MTMRSSTVRAVWEAYVACKDDDQKLELLSAILIIEKYESIVNYLQVDPTKKRPC